MIDPAISSLMGSCFLIWLTGFGIGKMWSFFETIYKKATGTH